MPQLPNNDTASFTYNLPDSFIAKYPLSNRDESKLLVYNNKIEEDVFYNINNYIPSGSLLINNNSKVIPARLRFQKETGGIIEIFCLEPLDISFEEAMNATHICKWKCYVGGAAKWQKDLNVNWNFEINKVTINCKANIAEKIEDFFVVQFNWNTNVSFINILDCIGKIPIPPYLKREMEEADRLQYQTIYAKIQGSVAAPTAGLHFTSNVLKSLTNKNISTYSLTLHVGAGTFKPITSLHINDHIMHAEWVQIDKTLIEKLLSTIHKQTIVCVGTTSLRSMESFYWWGMHCFANKTLQNNDFVVPQFMPYMEAFNTPIEEMLQWVLEKMNALNLNEINFKTQIMIAPGYDFKICNALITNFHQPNSTLLLLISAFTNNNWKAIYDYALTHNFRFLSFGDSSLLIRNK